MSRILFFLLLAAVAWIWFVRKPRKSGATRPEAARASVERIVQCAHCGLRVPEGEALGAGDDHYCCEEHRDAHRRQH